MAQFIAEHYIPRTSTVTLRTMAARIETAAAEVSGEGIQVRYVASTLLPEDEMCLCLFESTSRDAVERASARAGITVERVVQALHVVADDVAPNPKPPRKERR